MHLGANAKSKFLNLFLKHIPKNTILIVFLQTQYFVFEGKKNDPSIYSKKTDCHMTPIWREDVDKPSTVFLLPYFLEWEAKKDAKTKSVTRKIGEVAMVGLQQSWGGIERAGEHRDTSLAS